MPQALLVVYVTLLWATREAEVFLTFAGQLGCELVNYILKHLIKEERPLRKWALSENLSEDRAVGSGYGMPSSHAQFVFYWAFSVTLFLMVRHNPSRLHRVEGIAAAASEDKDGECDNNEQRSTSSEPPSLRTIQQAYRAGGLAAASASIEAYTHGPWTLTQRVIVSVAAFTIAILVSWSRVYLSYHTPRQVVAGAVAGTGCAIAWFAVTYVLRETGMLAWALELPVARWLRIRDLVVEEDVCQPGWEVWESRRRVTMQKERERERNKKKGE